MATSVAPDQTYLRLHCLHRRFSKIQDFLRNCKPGPGLQMTAAGDSLEYFSPLYFLRKIIVKKCRLLQFCLAF